MQNNFILTDLMKTGFHHDFEDFLNSHTLEDQELVLTGQYYDLHLYDLEKFDRKFALIDYRQENKGISGNREFIQEFLRRVAKLKKMGFVFVQSAPWECIRSDNASTPFYPRLDTIQPKHSWWGDASWWWWYMYKKHNNKSFEFDHSTKKYDFLYLNKMTKKHREHLWSALHNEKLLDNSLKTFHRLDPNLKLPPEYELPWVDRHNYPQRGFDQDVYEKPYNDCAVSIVSETVDDGFFITEKTYKPMLAKQLFVVHGPLGILKYLREMGFKTFGDFFDESYDQEKDKSMRVQKIVNTVKQIKGMDYKILYEKTKQIREHNQNILLDPKCLGNEINKTIKLFFEFADGSQVSSTKS